MVASQLKILIPVGTAIAIVVRMKKVFPADDIPTVKSRRPLWDLKHPEDPDWKYE